MATQNSKQYQKIVSTIQEAGGRMTSVRSRIINLLERTHAPLTIAQIVSKLKMDEVSVYRTLAYFKELDVIEEIRTHAGTRHFALKSDHHHHIICTQCDFVAHVPCTENVKKEKIHHQSFAHIDEHQVNYYGVCVQCSN